MTRIRSLPLNLFDLEVLRNRRLLTATLGHLSVDLFSGMMPLILVLQKDALGLSYSQVGQISMIGSLTGSVTQPFFGWLGDRWGHARLMVFSAIVASLAISVALAANHFSLLIMVAVVNGLASGAFHPQGAATASQVPAERRGSSLSIFMLGGNLGYSVGPIVLTAVLAAAGQYITAALVSFGLILSTLVALLALNGRSALIARQSHATLVTARAAYSLMVTVILVVFLRSWIQASISTYIPQLAAARGASTQTAGWLLFTILFPLAIGGLIGGTLSDRVGRKPVLVASTALMGPMLWGLLHSDGMGPYLFGMVLGISSGASVPVSIIMTQELVPRGRGLMSGIAMGLQFIAGAFGVWMTGTVADQIGLDSTLSWSVLVPLMAAMLALLLPSGGREKKRVAEATGARALER